MFNKNKAIKVGFLGSSGLIIFYFGIMILTMPSLKEVWYNFAQFWYFILLLVIGFGVQMGLWISLREHSKGGGAMSATSGTASGVSMLACCAHHLIEVLPILGISGATIFLARYQKLFLILGVTINLLGVVYLLNLYKKTYN